MASADKNVKIIKEKEFGEESLLPQEMRTLNNTAYFLAWVGGCVFIGYFMMGASLVPPVGELNLMQAVVCIVVSAVIVSICFNLNGQPGHKYGIPFVIQARHPFGMTGAKLISVIRSVPAIFWFGVQSWVGAQALNGVSMQLFKFDNVVFWFVAFQFLQIALAMLGFKGIKWVEIIGSIFIIFSLGYMLVRIYTDYGAALQTNVINIKGTWGMGFWGGTTAFLGVYTTLMLNISDYTREYIKESSNKVMLFIHIMGTAPTTLFMALIGLLSAGVTGKWDPIALFVDLMPNSVILVLALLFVAIAQITTNVMLNVIPPAYAIMNIFNVKYKTGAVITGLLSFLTFPWKIATADGFFLFIQIYSIFLGPIFAVMVVDYFLLRKNNYGKDINNLYNVEGPYKGINWAGIIAVVVGAACATLIVEISWYISLLPAGLTYYLLVTKAKFRQSPFVTNAKATEALE